MIFDPDRSHTMNLAGYLWGGLTWGAINILKFGADWITVLGPLAIALGGFYASRVQARKVRVEEERLAFDRARWEHWLAHPEGPPPEVLPASATVPGVKAPKVAEIDEVA